MVPSLIPQGASNKTSKECLKSKDIGGIESEERNKLKPSQ